MSKVHINLGNRSYDILIGKKLSEVITQDFQEKEKGKQGVLISNDRVFELYGKSIKDNLVEKGFNISEHIIPEGEGYKSWDTAGEILTKMLEEKVNRDAFVIALG